MTTTAAAGPRTPHRGTVRAVRERVREALAACSAGAVVLAVSGGRDSMVLLDAAHAVAGDRVAGVATFDHGTGAHARAAVRRVRRAARRLGLRCVVGRAALPDADEASWREARWRFLRRAARRLGATTVATAHTRDDQVETVAMRVLRGTGARGLAGLLADRPGVVRPLVDVPSAAVARYAAARRLRWTDDPGNATTRHLRNRLRLELLPALEAARPNFAYELLALGRRAAAWRRAAEHLAAQIPLRRDPATGAHHVAAAALRGYDGAALAVVWPALAARAGVRLDRRGTARLVTFTTDVAAESVAVGAAIPLAGGIEVTVCRGRRVPGVGVRDGGAVEFVLSRTGSVAAEAAGPVTVEDLARFGGWRFVRVAEAGDDPWAAWLPEGRPLTVRAWRPGDRIVRRQTARRVKRYLAEARVPAAARPGWPVVVAAGADGVEEILWVPGVCRSDAATDRPETPGQRYLCERTDRRSCRIGRG